MEEVTKENEEFLKKLEMEYDRVQGEQNRLKSVNNNDDNKDVEQKEEEDKKEEKRKRRRRKKNK